MADIKWIKLDIDVFGNRKIKQILSMPKGDTLVVIWLKMLCLAGKLGNSGALMLTSTKPYNIDTLAVEFGYSKPQVKAALEAFKELELIDVDDDGVISMHDWADHQNIDGMDKVRAQTKERQKRFRDKSTALQERCSNVTDNVTDNVTVTLHNAIEEERRKKKEEDIHSFVLSIKGENSIDGESVTDNVTDDAKKRKYLDGVGKGVVLLSDEQLDDLLDKLTPDEFDRYAGIVADNELSGKHYKRKTHYQAILDMALKDRESGR